MLLARFFVRRDSRSPSGSRGHAHRPSHVELLEDRTLLSGWVVDAVGTLDDPAGYGVTTDSTGNVYVAGYFVGSYPIAPGVTLTSAGGEDMFVAKYSPAGSLMWARRAGGSGNDRGKGIALDNNGSVYATGSFQGTADFGIATLTGAGGSDIYVTKLDASGNFVWTESAGSAGSDGANAIVLDSTGNAYIAGNFSNTVDFDTNTTTYSLTSAGAADIFVWQLDASGNFGWAKQAGSTNSDTANSIAVDSFGNVLTTGAFRGTVDFDPSLGAGRHPGRRQHRLVGGAARRLS
jgi:hypothetical protein